MPMTRRSSSTTAIQVCGVAVKVSRTTSRCTPWWIGNEAGVDKTGEGRRVRFRARPPQCLERHDTHVTSLFVDERRGLDSACFQQASCIADIGRAWNDTARHRHRFGGPCNAK